MHRIIATIVGLVVIWTLISALRRYKVAPGQAWMAVVAGVLFVAQSIVGGLIVLLDKPEFVAGLHLALATAVWGSLVLLAAMAANQLRVAPQDRGVERCSEAEEAQAVSQRKRLDRYSRLSPAILT